MDNTVSTFLSSGGIQYKLAINFQACTDNEIQAWACNYLKWVVQRSIREASDAQKAKFVEDGIHLHARDVGKKIVSAKELVERLSPEQRAQVYKLIKDKHEQDNN